MGFDRKIVFLVGCGRSGTTWLQLLLLQHTAAVSSQETGLFGLYLAKLEASWKQQLKTPRKVGLPGILSQAEFDTLMNDFATSVFAKIAATNPDARVLIEKTPHHLYFSKLI